MSAESSSTGKTSEANTGATPQQKKPAIAAAKPAAATKTEAPKPNGIAAAMPPADAAASWSEFSSDMAKFFEDSRKQILDALEDANGRFDGVRDTAQEVAQSWHESQTAALDGARELHQQTFDFVESEIGRCYAGMQEMSKAKDLSKLLEIQSEFLREGLTAQMEQTQACADMTADLFKAVWSPLQSGLSAWNEKLVASR